jgi:hypothetical protein
LVEVLVMMPDRFTEKQRNECCFTGQVTHIEQKSAPMGLSGVGVHFLYFEPVSPASPKRASELPAATGSA